MALNCNLFIPFELEPWRWSQFRNGGGIVISLCIIKARGNYLNGLIWRWLCFLVLDWVKLFPLSCTSIYEYIQCSKSNFWWRSWSAMVALYIWCNHLQEHDVTFVIVDVRQDTEPTTQESLFQQVYYKPKEHQANLAGVVQTREGWIGETRLSVAGEDGSEGKKQSEKQKSTQQHNYHLTFKCQTGKAREDEPEFNSAGPEQLTRNRWETGSKKSAYHTQPAQLRWTAKIELTSTS